MFVPAVKRRHDRLSLGMIKPSIQQRTMFFFYQNMGTVKKTGHKENNIWPPVVASVKINFLASLMLSGVTGTSSWGFQTLILLEKLMKLKWSPGLRSFRMVNRASLVWKKKEWVKKDDFLQQTNLVLWIHNLYYNTGAAVVGIETRALSIKRSGIWPAVVFFSQEGPWAQSSPGGWCQYFVKLG